MKKHLAVFLAAGLVLVSGQAALAHTDPSASHEEIRAHAMEHVQEARKSAQERVEQIKQQAAQRRVEIKQEVCERRQERLNALLPRLSQSANTVKTVIDKVFERVKDFYESGQLTVENYEQLVANIEAAQANAETILAAVASYQFEVDCDAQGVGQQLDGYREVVNQAKTALKDYRGELVELISALRAEAAEQSGGIETENEEAENSETEGGTSEQ